MKHPSWCDEDDCEEGWHMFSTDYSNGGLARIVVRLCEEINTGARELDLGNGDGSYNSISDEDGIKWEISQLKEFRDRLNIIIDAVESK